MSVFSMPNFQIGFALLDEDPTTSHVRDALHRRISCRVAVSPLGIGGGAMDGVLIRALRDCVRRSSAIVLPAIVETQLSKWCLSELGFEVSSATGVRDGDDGIQGRTRDYAKLWNGWVGYEEEIYRACSGLVASLFPVPAQ